MILNNTGALKCPTFWWGTWCSQKIDLGISYLIGEDNFSKCFGLVTCGISAPEPLKMPSSVSRKYRWTRCTKWLRVAGSMTCYMAGKKRTAFSILDQLSVIWTLLHQQSKFRAHHVLFENVLSQLILPMTCKRHKGNSQLNNFYGSVCRVSCVFDIHCYYRHDQHVTVPVRSLRWPILGASSWQANPLDLLISIKTHRKNSCVSWHQFTVPGYPHPFTPPILRMPGWQCHEKKSRASAAKHIAIFLWSKQGIHWTRLMHRFHQKWLASLKRPEHSQRKLANYDLNLKS